MKPPRPEQWLLLMFKHTLTMALVPKVAIDSFRAGQREYRCCEPNFLSAFYDRLVVEDDRLVGIRINPVSNAAHKMLRGLSTADYLSIKDTYIDVFLEGGIHGVIDSTGDQAFGGVVFRADDGEYAIALDINYFCTTESDFSAIMQAQATWLDVAWDHANSGASP